MPDCRSKHWCMPPVCSGCLSVWQTAGCMLRMQRSRDVYKRQEKQFLGVISSESERMARIVTDLLTLSKLDYGRMELRMTRFSVCLLYTSRCV